MAGIKSPVPFLKHKSQGELHLPGRSGCRRNGAHAVASDRCVPWYSKLRMVQRIEELGPERYVRALGDAKSFGRRELHVGGSWPGQDVSSGVSVAITRGRRNRKRRRTEPLLQ